MKILCISDLHLEFERKRNEKFSLSKNLLQELDVLILAGDISVGSQAFTSKYINRWQSKNKNLHIIYTPGNHEFYGSSFDRVNMNLYKSCQKRKNVHLLLNGNSVKINEVLFVGGTLWTNFHNNPIFMLEAHSSMNDYHVIKDFSPQKALKIHNRTLYNISESLLQEAQKKVVISHHAPSFQSIPEKYKSSSLSPAYYSSLENFILDRKIDYWFHGHIHDSMDYFIDETRIICNPRGYVGYELNPNFSLQPIEI